MRNGSVKSISRFKLGIGAAVVAVAALAMVAVLASTVGVISSQTNTDDPSVAFGSGTYIAVEGESLTITLTSRSSQGYELKLDADSTTPSSFNFKNDVGGLVLSPNVGKQELITDLPQTVDIDSGTTMITLWFRGANDLMTETGEQLVLSAKPGDSTAVNTTITLNDPPKLEATFSGPSPITEGGSARIGITLNTPLTPSQLFSRRSGESGYTREEFVGSNFEDISLPGIGTHFPVDDNNEQYNRNLGFDFWFYGKRHSYIAVHTNGFIGFTNDAKGDVLENVDTSPPGTNQGDKTPGAGDFKLPIVAPLLSPLAYHISDSYGMGITPRPIFHEARLDPGTANDRYIVQYTNARAGVPGVTNRVEVTFQVVLYASGTIEFRYEDIPTNVQQVSKIGIADGTGMGKFDEFSYRTNNFSEDAETNVRPEANVRLVYTPKDSRINAVIKDSEDNIFETVDFLANVPVGERMGSFSVSHPENTDWDGNQAYTVELASTVPLVTAPDPAPTYTVNDNDDPVVILKRADGSSISGAISIDEDSSVDLVAELTNAPSSGAPEALTVNLDVTGETNDYTVVPAPVTIAAGMSRSTFTVTAKQDEDPESAETLTIEVGDLMYGSGMVPKPSTPEKVDFTIPINDTIAVTGITASDTTEGDDVTVIVTLNRVLPAGTANAAVKLVLDGTDRMNDITGSEWNIGNDLKASTSVMLMLTLTEDTILEGDEEITLNVVVDSALDDIFPAGDRGSGVTFDILDNEDGTIGFIEPTKTTYNEGESVELIVGLASGVSLASSGITVNYQIGTSSVTRVATILAGQITAAITIASTDDSVAEETEMFQVTLTDASSSSNTALDAKVDISATSRIRDITVLDNEPLAYEFVGSGTMVSEGGGTPYTVRLRRLGMLPDSGSGARIAYTIAGSGISASDFVGGSPLSGNFVFSNYAAESAVTLTVADDKSLEGEETFRITAAGETLDVKLVDNESWDIGIVRSGSTDAPEEGDLFRFRIELMLEPGVKTTTDITVEYEITASPGLVAVSAPGLRSGFAQGLALPVRGLAQAQMVTLKRTATIPAGQSGVDIAIQLDESPDDTQQLTISLGAVSTNSGDPLPAVSFTGPSTPVAIPSALIVPVLDRAVEDNFGVLPPTGGLALPIWLVLLLALTGVVLLVPTLRRLI